jgi:hypothetical protein
VRLDARFSRVAHSAGRRLTGEDRQTHSGLASQERPRPPDTPSERWRGFSLPRQGPRRNSDSDRLVLDC